MQCISLFVTTTETKNDNAKMKHSAEIKPTYIMSQPRLAKERKNVLNNQWILILVQGDKLSRVKIVKQKNEDDSKKTSSKTTYGFC